MKIAIFQLSMFGINTYVVYDPQTRDCAIIDPGMSTQRENEAVDNFIKKNDLTVTHLINTHLHIDHVFGNKHVSDTYDVKPQLHADDMALGSRVKQQAQMFGMPESPENVEPGKYLKEGDIIHIGNGELKVLHVPGHSPGSIVLYDKKDGFAIVGDVLFQGSIGRTDLPGGNHQQLIEGIKEKLLTLPDDTVIYPGHGPHTTIGDEKRYNPYLH